MTIGFGTELWCQDSPQSGKYSTGVTNVALALYRRITTPRGTLRGGKEEEAYGIDVSDYIGSVGTEIARAALPSVVRAELLKDDRVADVSVSVSTEGRSNGLQTLTIELSVLLSDGETAFPLTVTADETSVALIGGLPQ